MCIALAACSLSSSKVSPVYASLSNTEIVGVFRAELFKYLVPSCSIKQ